MSGLTGAVGSVPAIALSTGLVVAWIVGGFFVRGGFANTLYQIIVSTVSSIVTFIMVFVIQSSQNRDSRALQAKLDAQGAALAAIAAQLDIQEERLALTRLVGVEDAPAGVIAAEQDSVRRTAGATAERLPP